MNIHHKNKEYQFLSGYQRDSKLRTELDRLVQKTFKISFEDWYQAGFWNDHYIPYTLFDDGKAVSNISVNIMDFLISGDKKRYIQLGAVMTDDSYRNQGLNRLLMEKIFDEWNNRCDLIYLFANHSVLDFYPKFGFHTVKEYSHFKTIRSRSQSTSSNIYKFNMETHEARMQLYDHVKHSNISEKLISYDNADLAMFYCAFMMKDHVHYLADLDAYAIITVEQNRLKLWDVFSKNELMLENIIRQIEMHFAIEEIHFGFTPCDVSMFQEQVLLSEDALFIQNDKLCLFDHQRIMLPLLSHG